MKKEGTIVLALGIIGLVFGLLGGQSFEIVKFFYSATFIVVLIFGGYLMITK
jgi:hypothetical protein